MVLSTTHDKLKYDFLSWISCAFLSCVSHAFASVHCCLVVTCWERADPLALVGVVYCIFITFQRESWVSGVVLLLYTKQDYTGIYEQMHEISNTVVCATSKASDQPAHTHSLIRGFASRLSIL